MGKKRRGAAGVVVGGAVRKREGTAAKRRKAVASVGSAEEDVLLGRGGGGEGEVDRGDGGCYLRLRGRRLCRVAAAVLSPEPLGTPGVEELLGGSGEEDMAGTGASRSASTATSEDAGAMERVERSGGADEEVCKQAGGDRDEESSVGDSGCGRERRETTPSSRPPGDSSDADTPHEPQEQKCNHGGRARSTTSSAAIHAPERTRSTRIPPAAAEIEEFLAAAEMASAERFAAKYNFDVVRGVPLDGAGRFEWTAVGSG